MVKYYRHFSCKYVTSFVLLPFVLRFPYSYHIYHSLAIQFRSHALSCWLSLKDKQSIVVMSGGGRKRSAEGNMDLRNMFAK